MKKKPLAVFVYSQVFSLLTPGFVSVAHAANLTNTNYRRGKQESSELSNELAQALTTIGENKQNAPEVLASTYASSGLTHLMNQYGHASASINFGDTSGERGKVTSADVNFLKPLSDKKNNVLFYQQIGRASCRERV